MSSNYCAIRLVLLCLHFQGSSLLRYLRHRGHSALLIVLCSGSGGQREMTQRGNSSAAASGWLSGVTIVSRRSLLAAHRSCKTTWQANEVCHREKEALQKSFAAAGWLPADRYDIAVRWALPDRGGYAPKSHSTHWVCKMTSHVRSYHACQMHWDTFNCVEPGYAPFCLIRRTLYFYRPFMTAPVAHAPQSFHSPISLSP